MYKQKLSNPYKIIKGVRHCTFGLRNKAGVYMIYKDGILMYVGMSSNNLYRTMYHHFHQWHSKQVRVTYNPDEVKVRVIYCTPLQADRLEKALIIKYKPIGNPNKYEQYTCDFQEEKVYRQYLEEETQPVIVTKLDENYINPF